MGKQLGPLRCKVCGGEHQGTLCTKFNTVRVLPPKTVPKPLALPAPPKPVGEKPVTQIKSKKPAKAKKAKKASKSKSGTSPKRKAYLAEKAKERRAAEKAGLSLEAYRAQVAIKT